MSSSTRIPFGNYQGSKISELPDDYLRWMVGELQDGDFANLADEADAELKRRAAEGGGDLEKQADAFLAQHGFGNLVKKDLGGYGGGSGWQGKGSRRATR